MWRRAIIINNIRLSHRLCNSCYTSFFAAKELIYDDFYFIKNGNLCRIVFVSKLVTTLMPVHCSAIELQSYLPPASHRAWAQHRK